MRNSLSVLLIEDDEADALLVEELLIDAVPGTRMHHAASMAHAREHLAVAEFPDCILLDLHLPDAHGIDALTQIHESAATVPVVVLTGLSDEHFGVSAVASGAQDYLVKGRVEPDALRRALHYSIERKRAERTAAELHTSQLRAQENSRLERGLLPSPLLLVDDPDVDIVTRYRPGRAQAVLGGDFYDVVQTDDRVVHALIGDVSGHGPDEAALGVALRIAWRTLVLAGIRGEDQMQHLERILQAERSARGVFATVTSLAIDAEGSSVAVTRAGHPPILMHRPDGVEWFEPPGGPALGVLGRSARWAVHKFDVPADCGMVLLTDGLFEGHSGVGNARLGEQGLLDVARSLAPLPPVRFVDELIEAAEACAKEHGGLGDDVAVVRVQKRKVGDDV